jgi:hypothetical protein
MSQISIFAGKRPFMTICNITFLHLNKPAFKLFKTGTTNILQTINKTVQITVLQPTDKGKM